MLLDSHGKVPAVAEADCTSRYKPAENRVGSVGTALVLTTFLRLACIHYSSPKKQSQPNQIEIVSETEHGSQHWDSAFLQIPRTAC